MSAPGPYDLTLADHDYAAWQGPPLRSLLICSHPRSGSTLLGEELSFAGGLGTPLEYLHSGFRPGLAERWGAPDIKSYMAAMVRWRTDTNGTFSIKLFWRDVEEMAHELSPDRFPPANRVPPEDMNPSAYRDLFKVISGFLPNPELVHLERLDRVRQAISAMVAMQTGLWRSIPGVGRQQALQTAEYDYEQIAGMIAFADASHDHWRNFFVANALSPSRITYESMIQEQSGVLADLIAHLGGETCEVGPRRMQRQSDPTSEAMMLQFLRDHAARQA